MTAKRIVLASLILAAACASTKGSYVAGKIEEPPPPPKPPAPPPVTVPPGQLRRAPSPLVETRPKDSRPWSVIERANSRATQRPDADGFFNAVMQYDFEPGALYQVYAAPLRITDIQLQPGERLLGKPAIGDSVRWIMGVGRSAEGGVETLHVYVKPMRPGLQTTLNLNTDRRTYRIELTAYRDTYMVAVQWNYPADDMKNLENQLVEAAAKDKVVTSNSVALDALNFSYRSEVAKGSPQFVPIQVFDDGRKTYIRFAPDMLVREAPALFVLSRNSDTQLVNYRMKNDTYIVDRLFDAAELRLGQQDQDIVRIIRTGSSAPKAISARAGNPPSPFGHQ